MNIETEVNIDFAKNRAENSMTPRVNETEQMEVETKQKSSTQINWQLNTYQADRCLCGFVVVSVELQNDDSIMLKQSENRLSLSRLFFPPFKYQTN